LWRVYTPKTGLIVAAALLVAGFFLGMALKDVLKEYSSDPECAPRLIP
jgi:F0F1-type ATP synthase membrane subunit c/vacuolar-type H+-ATPase subunit K